MRSRDRPRVPAIRTRGTNPLHLHERRLPDAIPGIGAVDPPAVDHWEVRLKAPAAAQQVNAVQVLFAEPTYLLPA
jgi:hypothetical protein